MEALLNALLSLLNEALEIGFDGLSPEAQANLIGYLDLLYVALQTQGKKFAESTENDYDDLAVEELLQAIENIAEDHGNGVDNVVDLKFVYEGE